MCVNSALHNFPTFLEERTPDYIFWESSQPLDSPAYISNTARLLNWGKVACWHSKKHQVPTLDLSSLTKSLCIILKSISITTQLVPLK
jgi:hypothetical protein